MLGVAACSAKNLLLRFDSLIKAKKPSSFGLPWKNTGSDEFVIRRLAWQIFVLSSQNRHDLYICEVFWGSLIFTSLPVWPFCSWLMWICQITMYNSVLNTVDNLDTCPRSHLLKELLHLGWRISCLTLL